MLYKRADELQCHIGHCIIKMFLNPQYNPSSFYNVILQASIIAMSHVIMSYCCIMKMFIQTHNIILQASV